MVGPTTSRGRIIVVSEGSSGGGTTCGRSLEEDHFEIYGGIGMSMYLHCPMDCNAKTLTFRFRVGNLDLLFCRKRSIPVVREEEEEGTQSSRVEVTLW